MQNKRIVLILPLHSTPDWVNGVTVELVPTDARYGGRGVRANCQDDKAYACLDEEINRRYGNDRCLLRNDTVYMIMSGESMRSIINSMPDKMLRGISREDDILTGPAIYIYSNEGFVDENGHFNVRYYDHWVTLTRQGLHYQTSATNSFTAGTTSGVCSSTTINGSEFMGLGDIWVDDPFNQYINKFTSSSNSKGDKNMNFQTTNLFKNIYFGKAPRDFALSFNNQITYRGKYYENGMLNDTCGLTIDLDGMLYIMPTNKITKGDIIFQDGKAFYYDGENFIDYTSGLKAEYVPTRVFNMTFYSVVKNIASGLFAQATDKSNPMANMLPFMLLSKDSNSDDLVKFMLLSQGGFNLFGATEPAKKSK